MMNRSCNLGRQLPHDIQESDDNAQRETCVNIVREAYDTVIIFRLGSLHPHTVN